jgi:hypothetical protein
LWRRGLRGESPACRDGHVDPDVDPRYTIGDTDLDAHRHTDPYPNPHANPHSDGHPDAHADQYVDGDAGKMLRGWIPVRQFPHSWAHTGM